MLMVVFLSDLAIKWQLLLVFMLLYILEIYII